MRAKISGFAVLTLVDAQPEKRRISGSGNRA